MASPCIVKFCKNIGNHRFPKDELRRETWINAIKHIKPGFMLKKNSYICSAHFMQTDFSVTLTYFTKDKPVKVLKRNAVPSIFSWSQTSQQSREVNQQSLSPSKTWLFDPSKVQATYARTPSIGYVEMPPVLATDIQEVIEEDPLQLPDDKEFEEPQLFEDEAGHYTEIVSESLLIGTGSQEIEENIEDFLPSLNLEEDKHIYSNEIGNQSVQTQTPEVYVMLPQELESLVHRQTHTERIGFSIYNYKDDEKGLHFYTGLENYKKLMLVFCSLGKGAHSLNYFYGQPPQNIDALEQFFITLIILRRHTTFEEISMMFKLTIKHVYSIFITWIRFMALQWRNLNLWIDRENVNAYAPSDFNDKYPATRVIIDATECPIKKPKLPLAQQITFSSYKNKNTVKFLIGISPGGLISYISPTYGGSATDRQIIERSSILHKFDYNDEIMVDKGLNVQDIFLSYGVKVNMPAFFKKGNQIGADTLSLNRKVASKRVHVERVIGMLKTYKILTQPMNQTEVYLSSDIVLIIAMLVNFRSNIINKNA